MQDTIASTMVLTGCFLSDMSSTNTTITGSHTPLKILHLFRSPVGGLFRHVSDLIQAQIDQGLNAGIVCDSLTGGEFANKMLEQLAPGCALGVHRLPMSRVLNVSDLISLYRVNKISRTLMPDIIHGHGAKGGAFARILAGQHGAKSVYTPHGGSLHYKWASSAGFVFLGLERVLKRYTDGLIFESNYVASEYRNKVGRVKNPCRVIHNGLKEDEFHPVTCHDDCKNFLFVGELRKLKGIEVLLKATIRLRERHNVSLLIVGTGPHAGEIRSLIRDFRLESSVTISPQVFPAVSVFSQADCLVVPSLAESLPYVALEAAAAGLPLIASDVGGISEITGAYSDYLVPPNDPAALANAMYSVLTDRDKARRISEHIHERVRDNFRLETMVKETLEFYDHVIKTK
jgi:glycosyltransferase involved in cell wall biosynthesis